LGTIFEVLGIVTVISFITPTFILGLIPIVILYIYQQIYFTRTYRVLKRIDSIRRSPQFSLLNETLDGVITVRAFRAEGNFLKRMKTLLDQQQAAYFLTCTAQCWLAVRLELAGLLIIVLACLSLVVQHRLKAGEEKFVGLAGLSISCALAVTQALNWSVRMGADLDAQMVAVERVQQYRSLPREASQVLLSDKNVDPSWPSKGEIHFINCFLRYRSNMPMVLNGLSFKIPSKAKVGCCGRTGSGKSTIVAALLRLVELESGSILIDGIGIKDIGLHLLRSKVAVIPQDPVLFSGNMRNNLDPFKRFTDRKLIKALKRVGLMNNSARACDPVKTLDDRVVEGGKNYSVGQRQLIAFARAILSDAKIVLVS
jgi:ATP-binding cassette subfamily C (CFTR/MRP) protein 1